ncbi:MAG: GNAT family N-acetyltransferase [Nanoarchaeota archaeon]|nr:GNAT family N-acetyltransferase [Nanoarchaeota archaeon]
MPKLTLKNAIESDFEDVFKLTKGLWPNKKFNKAAEKSEFLHEIKHKEVIVAKGGKRVLGVAITRIILGKIAFLDELIVHKKHHHVGTHLLEKVYYFSKQNSCNFIFLLCAPHRKSSYVFYRDHGFKRLFFLFYRSI